MEKSVCNNFYIKNKISIFHLCVVDSLIGSLFFVTMLKKGFLLVLWKWTRFSMPDGTYLVKNLESRVVA